jgi:hypothetical protein
MQYFSLDYVKTFWEELTTPGPRIPITKNRTLFQKMAAMGKQLICYTRLASVLSQKALKSGVFRVGRRGAKLALQLLLSIILNRFHTMLVQNNRASAVADTPVIGR